MPSFKIDVGELPVREVADVIERLQQDGSAEFKLNDGVVTFDFDAEGVTPEPVTVLALDRACQALPDIPRKTMARAIGIGQAVDRIYESVRFDLRTMYNVKLPDLPVA